MNLRLASWLTMSLLCAVGVAWADEQPQPAPSPLTLPLEELERVDQELADARQRLKSARSRAERMVLHSRIEELEAAQEQLLQTLERLVGPLPPAVRPDSSPTLEEQLTTQQRHHDALLERDVDRRLPSR